MRNNSQPHSLKEVPSEDDNIREDDVKFVSGEPEYELMNNFNLN
jgi:hypothetical protein